MSTPQNNPDEIPLETLKQGTSKGDSFKKAPVAKQESVETETSGIGLSFIDDDSVSTANGEGTNGQNTSLSSDTHEDETVVLLKADSKGPSSPILPRFGLPPPTPPTPPPIAPNPSPPPSPSLPQPATGQEEPLRNRQQPQIARAEEKLNILAQHDTFYLERRRDRRNSNIIISVQNQRNRVELFIVQKVEEGGCTRKLVPLFCSPEPTLNFFRDGEKVFYAIKEGQVREKYYVYTDDQSDNLRVALGDVTNADIDLEVTDVNVYENENAETDKPYRIDPEPEYMQIQSVTRYPCRLNQFYITCAQSHAEPQQVGIIICGDRTEVKLGLGDSQHQLSNREKAVLLAASVRVFETYFAPIYVCGLKFGRIGEYGWSLILYGLYIVLIIVIFNLTVYLLTM